MSKGIGGHQSARMKSDEHITPLHIIKSLGEFDLDPCSPIMRPWDTAKKHYSKLDDGLIQPWDGRVWLNPPYGNEIGLWLEKMADHNNGIALTFGRLEIIPFRKFVYPVATSMLAIYGRLTFLKNIYDKRCKTGIRETVPQKHNSGAPSVLIAYGEQNSEILEKCGIPGFHFPIQYVPVIVVGVDPSWKIIIEVTITRLDGKAEVSAIYRMVEKHYGQKVAKNSNYKEKIRQRLQQYFTRVKRGVYSK